MKVLPLQTHTPFSSEIIRSPMNMYCTIEFMDFLCCQNKKTDCVSKERRIHTDIIIEKEKCVYYNPIQKRNIFLQLVWRKKKISFMNFSDFRRK